jgi:Tfp pilus assembly protein PilF
MRSIILAITVTVTLAGCQTAPLTAGKSPDPGSFLFGNSDKELTEASKLEQTGNAERAKELYAEITRRNPRHGQAHHRLAVLLDRQGESAKAAESYEKALACGLNDADFLCDFGYNQYLLRNYKQAETYLHQSLTMAPGLARAHNNLGLVMAHAGRPNEAIREFLIAGNNEGEARNNLAYAQMWQQHGGNFGGKDPLTLGATPATLARSVAPTPPAAQVMPQFSLGGSNSQIPFLPQQPVLTSFSYPE